MTLFDIVGDDGMKHFYELEWSPDAEGLYLLPAIDSPEPLATGDLITTGDGRLVRVLSRLIGTKKRRTLDDNLRRDVDEVTLIVEPVNV